MKKIPSQGETISTMLNIPKGLSIKLSRAIMDRYERGEKRVSKSELIFEFIEKGLKQEMRNGSN